MGNKNDNKSKTVVLIAHGSRKQDWLTPFETLQKHFCETLNLKKHQVVLSYMEIAHPSLEEVIETNQNKSTCFSILPLFMSNGGHVKNDIASKISNLELKYPNHNFELINCVGEHPEVIDAMTSIVRKLIV
ncbi:hypothetical protein HOG98_05125 [bacterium]|jgi:sirohydrochlorin cobaltochelatase|nr:hypothetical protein [bacterium]